MAASAVSTISNREQRTEASETNPAHQDIAVLAYVLWQQRGCLEGTAEQDWLDAEQQLKSLQPAE